MQLLLDEHISPAIVQLLAESGVFAQAVPHVGLGGAPDEQVWSWAAAHSMAVVTTNARDFLLLAEIELHPGLIVLRESGLSRKEQWERIAPVVEYVRASGDPDFLLNKIVEVTGPGKFQLREID